MTETRAYGIVGNPYSGSTLLCFVLGGAPGVFATCETADILKRPDHCRCRQCGGRECPFWTKAFLASLRRSPDDIHELVRRRAGRDLGAEAVVFSDKDPAVYRRGLERGNRVDGLILLFKRPEAFVFSALSHTPWSVTDALDRYVARQQRVLGLFGDFAVPSVVVFYDDLARRPGDIVPLLCGKLGIPFEPGMLDFGKNRDRFHTLGGNSGTYAHLKTREELLANRDNPYWKSVYSPAHVEWILENHGRIALDEKWKTGLTADQRSEIERHGPSRELFEKLFERRLGGRGPMLC